MRPLRLGLRREVLILLPAALLILVVLSTFTLFSYRSSLARFAADRRDEAARLARNVAGQLAGQLAGHEHLPDSSELRQLAPGAAGVAIVDAAGVPLVETADLPFFPVPASGSTGPGAALPDAVAGFAPLPVGGQEGVRWVRVDLGAEVLAGQQRVLQVLMISVLSINGALIVLVLAFLGHLLAPYEALLARARAMAGDGGSAGSEVDEMQFLLDTFEEALAALAGRDARRAEDDIAALERTLAPSLQSGLLLLDREGDVLALNAVGAELLGIPPPAPGTPSTEVLAGQSELSELLAGAVATGSAPSRAECAVRSGRGETLTVGLTVHPLRRDDGGTRGFVVLFADLTEVRKRSEESRLAESLARLGEMAGGIAHELRNSLATLSGYLTLIERRPDEESVADYLAEIRHEAAHLERVLDDFLSFARPGTARMSELSLDRLLQRAAADPSLAGVEVRVATDPAGEVSLRGDPQLLERAVRNLLHNAAQAEREAGRSGPVHAAVARRDDGAVLVIEDRGPGLPPEIRERLFHPFATGRRGGVGLGLALAHRIVVLHGGRIRLDDRPGGGTRAELFFPRDTSAS
ncbi:MAG TPA: ATP-binding protein [Thermoanaerobaculia bacterium]|nr:ATP-binding protein [Thermoanaerobaculia bacterium]